MAIPTITDANAYHTPRLTAAWLDIGLDNEDKTAALYRAQDYILASYRFAEGILETDPLILEATIMLAPELLVARSLTQSAAILESEKELEGAGRIRLKFAEGSVDPYPLITAKLRTIASAPFATSRTAKLGL